MCFPFRFSFTALIKGYRYIIAHFNEIFCKRGDTICGQLVRANQGKFNVMTAQALRHDGVEETFVICILPLCTQVESSAALQYLVDWCTENDIEVPFYCADNNLCNPRGFDDILLPSIHHLLGFVGSAARRNIIITINNSHVRVRTLQLNTINLFPAGSFEFKALNKFWSLSDHFTVTPAKENFRYISTMPSALIAQCLAIAIQAQNQLLEDYLTLYQHMNRVALNISRRFDAQANIFWLGEFQFFHANCHIPTKPEIFHNMAYLIQRLRIFHITSGWNFRMQDFCTITPYVLKHQVDALSCNSPPNAQKAMREIERVMAVGVEIHCSNVLGNFVYVFVPTPMFLVDELFVDYPNLYIRPSLPISPNDLADANQIQLMPLFINRAINHIARAVSIIRQSRIVLPVLGVQPLFVPGVAGFALQAIRRVLKDIFENIAF